MTLLSSRSPIRPETLPDAAVPEQLVRAPDNKLTILPQLPLLALSLLVCAARLELVLYSDLINFNMAYDEYTSLMSKAKSISLATNGSATRGRPWSFEKCLAMWNHLVELELLTPAGALSSVRKLVDRTEMCKVDVTLEEIRDITTGLDGQLKDWCKI